MESGLRNIEETTFITLLKVIESTAVIFGQIMERKLEQSAENMDEIRICVVGPTGGGKSSLLNTILDDHRFETGLSPKPVTRKIQEASYKRGRHSIRVVDTPGMFDSYFSETEIVKELKQCCTMISPGPHVVLFVMRIGHYLGPETFKSYLDYFGQGILEHTVIVFTGLDILEKEGSSLDQYFSNAPPFFNDILRKYKHTVIDSTKATNDSSQQLQEMIESTTKENQTHSHNIASVLNKKWEKVASIVKSRKQDYENEQRKIISAIETILAYPVSKRTRSRNWLVEVENILNGTNWQELLERLPEKSRIQLKEIYDKENMGIKRRAGHCRDASPSISNIVKRTRQTPSLSNENKSLNTSHKKQVQIQQRKQKK
ncbi:hypothetical protein KUTeg_020279 [Tegillarca granosa]|uniref:AIG1-type G domain-containing protein n=1 Tax=Tegillarca granosa TaxID=220873 RepID=A0ABQ9EBN0_TEGGR|nr:hypothetical protein KUTeg_020279 [Tegillarca granosa]